MIPYYNRDYAWNKGADNASFTVFDDGTRTTVTLAEHSKKRPSRQWSGRLRYYAFPFGYEEAEHGGRWRNTTTRFPISEHVAHIHRRRSK